MKSVVIGGGGFIGSHIAEALLRAGDDVIVFDRPDARHLGILAKQRVKIMAGNFLEVSDLTDVLSDADIVYHLVSSTVPKTSNEDPVYDIETNLIGTVNFLISAKKAGAKKIIFSSSGGTVYGIPRNIPIQETHPTNPICSYGIVKLAIEKYAQLFFELYGLDYRILRIANAYGERQPMNSSQGVLPMIIGNALQGKKITIWGDGSVIRDYVYVSDIVDAFVKIRLFDGDQRIFNIGSGVGHSVIELLRVTETILGQQLDVDYQKGQAYDVPVNILNVSLAKECLGWFSKVDITMGISRIIQYMKSYS